MTYSAHPALANEQALIATGQFSAQVNGRLFRSKTVAAYTCLQTELDRTPNRQIWKVLARGTVARQNTHFGFYIDRCIEPGTHSLAGNERICVVYHLAPKPVAKVYHSRDFQSGSLTLLECDPASKRLRGTFEFGISAIPFCVTEGRFDLHWTDAASLR